MYEYEKKPIIELEDFKNISYLMQIFDFVTYNSYNELMGKMQINTPIGEIEFSYYQRENHIKISSGENEIFNGYYHDCKDEYLEKYKEYHPENREEIIFISKKIIENALRNW